MNVRKVCFFLPSSNRDGAELSALECMEALQSLGIVCHVVVPKDGPLLADLRARQISYQIIPYHVWVEAPVPINKRLLVTLWNLVIAYGAVFLVGPRLGDLVITNTINICVGALVAKLRGRPHVWYIREFGYEDHGWRFHLGEKLSRWIMDRLSLRYLTVSRAVARKYQQDIAAGKVSSLYQPIEVDQTACPAEALPGEQSRFTFIIVGRLQEGKRQEDAVRAMGELRNQGIPAQLWIVGAGDRVYADFLQTLVRDKSLSDRVTFFGQVKNAFPYIRQADALLLCSRCEAFARVVVEGMKAGKPVLGASSGGTIEQITDGFNGFLYQPRDHRELAAKMKYLCEHPEEARQMGKNGQQWARHNFTRERYQQELAKILGLL